MKKIFELKDFDTFVKELYESRIQKKSDVASAVEKIKEKYGDNARDFIAKIVQPIDRLNPRELNPDYDSTKTNKETIFFNFLITRRKVGVFCV